VQPDSRLPTDGFDHFGVAKERLWGTCEDHLAVIHGIRAIGDLRGIDQIGRGDRIACRVSTTGARLATGSSGLTLGRAGCAPAGRHTKFRGDIASSNSL